MGCSGCPDRTTAAARRVALAQAASTKPSPGISCFTAHSLRCRMLKAVDQRRCNSHEAQRLNDGKQLVVVVCRRGSDRAALLGAAVVRYSAPGIRPGGRPFFLLAKRKKAKKALQFNTMALYTSSITKAADHSPARRARTEAYLKTEIPPSICRLRRLLVQTAGHVAGAKAPVARRPPFAVHRQSSNRLCRAAGRVITSLARWRLFEPARRASRYSPWSSTSCISTWKLFFQTFLC